MIEQTLVLVKPDGIKKRLIGEIIKKYEDKGLSILNIKMISPIVRQVEEHYIKKNHIFMNW
jgi:nucleoside-diphosphate kinase